MSSFQLMSLIPKLQYKVFLYCTHASVQSSIMSKHCNSLFLYASLAVDNPYDYLGRSYLHIPQDVDVDLRSDEPPDRCYAPKKLIHAW